MWHLALSWYGFRQVNWNSLQYWGYKNILLFSACVFWYVVLFNKKLIVLHHDDNTFLFYFDIQSQTFSNNPNDREITWCLFCIIKQLLYDRIFGIISVSNSAIILTVSGKLPPGKFPPINPIPPPPGKFPSSKFPPRIFPAMFLNIPTRVFKSCIKKIVACRSKFDNRSLL